MEDPISEGVKLYRRRNILEYRLKYNPSNRYYRKQLIIIKEKIRIYENR